MPTQFTPEDGDKLERFLWASSQEEANALAYDFIRTTSIFPSLQAFLLACESPIEAAFALALVRLAILEPGLILFYAPSEKPLLKTGVHIFSQYVIKPFRVDFFFVVAGRDIKKKAKLFAVECDGHAYHERTAEQARRDKERDRQIMTTGTRVIRFTGSEINHSSGRCVVDLFRVIRGIEESGA